MNGAEGTADLRRNPPLTPDDPRHGDIAGHVAGCRNSCCTTVRSSYDKRRRYAAHVGKPFTLTNVGVVRRIRALQAIGWSLPQIAREAGISAKTIHSQLYYDRGKVRQATMRAVADAYERLCMNPWTGHYSDANRRKARENGWSPPLAWDDDTIDDPQAQPHKPRNQDHQHGRDHVDPIVVERVLAGERMPWTTPAEKAEVVRRWTAAGRSLSELERLTGWKSSRYTNQTARRAS